MLVIFFLVSAIVLVYAGIRFFLETKRDYTKSFFGFWKRQYTIEPRYTRIIGLSYIISGISILLLILFAALESAAEFRLPDAVALLLQLFALISFFMGVIMYQYTSKRIS